MDLVRGRLIKYKELYNRLSPNDISKLAPEGQEFLCRLLRKSIQVHEIIYSCVDQFQKTIMISGVVATPITTNESLPLVSYQRGTVINRYYRNDDPQMIFTALVLASNGYFAIMPDYIGYQESEGFHPYLHANTSANTVIDMVRSSKEFAKEKKIELNDKLFLIGYSEGGFVTMAAHKKMENAFQNEFEVSASAPMEGPYSLSGVIRKTILDTKNRHPVPQLFIHLILNYNQTYKLSEDLNLIFQKTIVDNIVPLFEGDRSKLNDFSIIKPMVLKETLNNAFFEDFSNDDSHPLQLAFRKNDLDDWTPLAPMKLYHYKHDPLVPYNHSEQAFKKFVKNGAKNVEFELDETLIENHSIGAKQLLSEGLAWFEKFL